MLHPMIFLICISKYVIPLVKNLLSSSSAFRSKSKCLNQLKRPCMSWPPHASPASSPTKIPSHFVVQPHWISFRFSNQLLSLLPPGLPRILDYTKKRDWKIHKSELPTNFLLIFRKLSLIHWICIACPQSENTTLAAEMTLNKKYIIHAYWTYSFIASLKCMLKNSSS